MALGARRTRPPRGPVHRFASRPRAPTGGRGPQLEPWAHRSRLPPAGVVVRGGVRGAARVGRRTAMTGAESTAVLWLRAVLGATMIVHRLHHWRGGGRIAGTARWFTGLGLRHGRLQAWLSVVPEVGAGALLVLGLLTPLAGAAVISVMLVAGLLAHRRNGFFVFKDGYEYVLLIAVVCLLLGALGPGHFSVDYAAGIQ